MSDKPDWISEVLELTNSRGFTLEGLIESAWENPRFLHILFMMYGKGQLLTLKEAAEYTGLTRDVILNNRNKISHWQPNKDGHTRYFKAGLAWFILTEGYFPIIGKQDEKPKPRTRQQKEIMDATGRILEREKTKIKNIQPIRKVKGVPK